MGHYHHQGQLYFGHPQSMLEIVSSTRTLVTSTAHRMVGWDNVSQRFHPVTVMIHTVFHTLAPRHGFITCQFLELTFLHRQVFNKCVVLYCIALHRYVYSLCFNVKCFGILICINELYILTRT